MLFGVMALSAPGSATMLPERLVVGADFSTAAPAAEQAMLSNQRICSRHHASSCHTGCKQPFMRQLGQRSATSSKKRAYVAVPVRIMGLIFEVRPNPGQLAERLRIAGLNQTGSPYKDHRARTGRQLL